MDPALSGLLVGLGLDVVTLTVLVGWLYAHRDSAPEMRLVFVALNIGLFAAVAAIGGGDFPVGVGFGLFGLLSLVRLRSAAFTVKDVAYTFVALVIALVSGLPERHLWFAVALDLVLVVAVWAVDDSRKRPATRVMRMTLDRAMADAATARAEVTARLGSVPLAVVVEQVDFVRETTVVAVRHQVEEAWSHWAPAPDTTEADQDLAVREAGPRG